MRKLVASIYLSLDGVMGDPGWTIPYWSDEVARFKFDELFSSDALLLGRETYEGFASAWPGRTDEQGFADRMNSLPKYVATTRLENLPWNNSHAIRSDLIGAVRRLKEQDGLNILIYGSSLMASALLRENLIDQLNLLVYPILLGKGKRFFLEGTYQEMNLTETQSFPAGVVLLRYEPKSKS